MFTGWPNSLASNDVLQCTHSVGRIMRPTVACLPGLTRVADCDRRSGERLQGAGPVGQPLGPGRSGPGVV